MGLDMYAFTRDTAPESAVDFPSVEGDEELYYWRKHPNLHGWMENLYREKGGTEQSFNCVNVVLTSADIDRLEAEVNGGSLPLTSGFFFGQSHPEDREDDLKFIAKARQALARGSTVYYTSWW